MVDDHKHFTRATGGEGLTLKYGQTNKLQ